MHFEKLRNRVDGDAAVPFEASLGAISADENDGVRWWDCDLRPPVLKQAAELFQDGLSVREVAASLRISKTEAGRLRLRASDAGMIVAGHDADPVGANGHASWVASDQLSPIQG